MAFSLVLFGSLALPANAEASTVSTMRSDVLGWVNAARSKAGLAPLHQSTALTSLANSRAATLAANDTIAHDAAGCLKCQLASRGIKWNALGENTGWTSYPAGHEAAQSLFSAWKASPPHWAILMGKYDTIGLGFFVRADGKTFSSLVLIDAPGTVAAAPVRTPRPAATPKPAAATPMATPDPTPAFQADAQCHGTRSLPST
jgi:uncharacterized protein YkwD